MGFAVWANWNNWSFFRSFSSAFQTLPNPFSLPQVHAKAFILVEGGKPTELLWNDNSGIPKLCFVFLKLLWRILKIPLDVVLKLNGDFPITLSREDERNIRSYSN